MKCKHELRCTNKDYFCDSCKHNPNAEPEDYFVDRGYIPSCTYGHKDCINDPARLLYLYDKFEWIRNRFDKKKLEKEAQEGCFCEDEFDYDDEDK